MALSTAPMPTKGIEEAKAMDRLETSILPVEADFIPAAKARSALTAASNSDLQTTTSEI